MTRFTERADTFGAKFLELLVCNGDDDRIVDTRFGSLDRRDAVFVLRFAHVNPGVVNVSLDVVLLQFADDIDNLGVAQVRAVFLER